MSDNLRALIKDAADVKKAIQDASIFNNDGDGFNVYIRNDQRCSVIIVFKVFEKWLKEVDR